MAAPKARRARWNAALRSTTFKVTAAVAAVGALVTGAFLAGGYDVTQTKVDDSSVWALQQGQGERYARVDTALGQLDTVKSVTNPSGLVQSPGHVLLFAQNDAKVASVDLAQPAGYTSGASGFESTPAGTDQVVQTGDYIGYLTATGEVHAARIEDGTKHTAAVPAPGSDGKRAFSADTIAIGTDGILYAYSHTTRTVLRFDIDTGRVVGTDAVPGGPTRSAAALTVVGSTWVLVGPGWSSMWIKGVKGRIATGIKGAKPALQQPSAAQGVVVAASPTQLLAFDLKTGKSASLAHGDGGAPAAPVWQGSRLYAAWVPFGTGGGQLYAGRAHLGDPPTGTSRKLDYGPMTGGKQPAIEQAAVPVFRSDGGSEILNDTMSGWVWSVPSGAIVQGSQAWDLNQDQQVQQNPTNNPADRETNPEPPKAVDDSFGVRAGSLVSLPVLLNDYDPNGDVLSIVPGSVTGLSPGFGAASIADNGQTVTVRVTPNATGTATFHYVDTDGTAGDGGLKSGQATVTLTVRPSSQNSPPAWCNADPACTLDWPSGVDVAPSGSVEVPVLRGWVDPDGDPIFVSSATAPGDSTVSVSPDGTLVFQAAADAKPGDVAVTITVSDIFGATAQKVLHITITDQPQLQVENFGLMTAVGVPLTVDPSAHIRGAKGTPQITSATLTQTNAATTTVDSSGSTFDFVATQAGSYPVTMTVTDSATKSTVTATVRITVVPAGQSLLSTSPVTVFVRPQTDTSVDVFSAVQNPTGRVLLLSDAQPHPAAGASLDVDVVGESQLRVRGTTGTGAAGLLGTVSYLVNDGTSDPSMQVVGTATVYLLPDTSPTRPVAVNDSVTVRAGAQIDIPVLANDVASNGDTIELDPSSIQNPSHEGLAFASGQVLRYLAPSTSPGSPVTLRYSAYSAGNPTAKATATVTVTILGPGGDRPPQPPTLTGRVVAGASVRIPFDPYGVDPDGDMVSLDRIMTQPKGGTAQISADGTAIIFTALANSEGQQTFSYRVRDSEGETGVASVMIGVLNAQTDPAPVTFSDYVQVQAGADNQVVVQPTANDVDPTGGALTLLRVTPDAQSSSSLYPLLQSHIASQNSSQVVITSTPNPRTLTYTYFVKNAQGDVSAGLIVVDVVLGHVPDYPIAVDTVVDAQSRAQLAEGIDVVHGKVSWGSGDINGLKLSPYGKHAGVTFSGDRIKVTKVPDSGLLVPFQLSGPDFTGQVETTYGFLRIPPLSDVILALKSTARPLQVAEGSSGHVDLDSIISVPPHATLIPQNGAVKTSGARSAASCSVDGTTLSYVAGDGAPWSDVCLVPVRLATQQDYTMIAVPIQIIPKQPLPALRPASLTASPGSPAVTFDLAQMTTWLDRDNEIGQLHYRVSYTGSLFTLTQNGQTLSLTAKDTAQPGLEEVAHVSIVGYSGAGTTADITLKVGPAPSTRPAGGSTALSCSEATGSSCSATVVGLRDEVNAYPHTPLKVVGVASSVTGCTGVTFRVADSRTITASWSASAPGGTCTVPFTVQDAQGRRSESGAGDGKLSFQLKGFPPAPASVAEVAYTGTSVTLAVTPGGASSAFPALTGFHIYLDGTPSVTCTANGACPPIGGLKNGQKHTFMAKAVNSVGESHTGPTTTGWAFTEPVVRGVTATPVYDPNVQKSSNTGTGAFDLTIPNSDSSANGYRISVGGGAPTTVAVGSGGSTVVHSLTAPAGTPATVTVTPLSEFSQPPGEQAGGQSSVSTSVTPAGFPLIGGTAGFSTTDSSITVSGMSGNPNGSDKADASQFFAVPVGQDPQCSNSGENADIDYSIPGAPTASASAVNSTTIDNLTQFATYEVFMCYTNEYGAAEKDLGHTIVWDQSKAPVPSGCTYSITQQGTGLPDYEYGSGAPSCSSAQQQGAYSLDFDYANGDSQSTFGATPTITARYCAVGQTFCGASVPVKASNSAPFQMRVTSATPQCTAPATGSGALTVSLNSDNGVQQAGPTVTVKSYQYTKDGTTWTAGTDPTAIPAGTTQVRSIAYTITWGVSGFASYNGSTGTSPTTCTAN